MKALAQEGILDVDDLRALPLADIKTTCDGYGFPVIITSRLRIFALWCRTQGSDMDLSAFSEDVLQRECESFAQASDKHDTTGSAKAPDVISVPKRNAIQPSPFSGTPKTWEIFRLQFEAWAGAHELTRILRHSSQHYHQLWTMDHRAFVDPHETTDSEKAQRS